MSVDDHDDRDIEEALDRGESQRVVILLVARYYTAVHRFCRLKCERGADDVVQTIFEHVCRDVVSFERRISVRAWLFGITIHRIRDHQRVTAKQRERFELGSIDDETPDSNPWSRVNYALDEPVLLDMFMDELEAHVASAIRLRYLEELTYPEMQKICGDAPATLERRVARGISHLQKRYKRLWQIESRGWA